MNEKFDIEDNIEIFNANFECENEEQIKNLYKTKKSTENNDDISKKIRYEKYNHPLLLNYNYCLFCLERRKTKYNQKNLDDMHNITTIKTICEFLEKEQIDFRVPQNKIEKLTKRRFIHSCEPIQKKIIEINQYYDSDTELYITKKDNNNENTNAINFYKKIRSTLKGKKLSDMIKKDKKQLKKSSKQISSNYGIDSFFEDEKSNDDNNNNIIKNTLENSNKKGKAKLTKTYNPNINKKSLSKKNVVFHSKTKLNKSKQEESENIIFNSDRKSLDATNKKEKSFLFFGFLTNYFNSNKESEVKNSVFEKLNESDVKSFHYYEKNEKCGICLGEIQDKYTLICGDFFCKKCIIDLLEDRIDNISSFEKMECPRCHESINESTIIYLLNNEYLRKYNKIKTKIEGLKNKNNVPCPHPDCEGFALKEKEVNGTLECNNGHIFCHKCLEEIHSNIVHTCIDKYPETNKYLSHDKNIKRCPQCNSWVQRDPGGCNNFTCPNIWCNYNFCWICGKQYDESHYKNPLSICFGLSKSDIQGNIIRSESIRRIRCILIALLCILILLPIVCIFFSFFIIGFFVFIIQFDGKELRNVTFHSKGAHKAFYLFYILFIIFISLALIPFGYICLVILLLSIPIIIIISKVRKKKNDDF